MKTHIGISPIEAARCLGVSRSTIYRIIKSGQLRTIKIGRRTIVPVSALTTLVEYGMVGK